MILYATKQTIKDLNIPMVDELSQFNRMFAQKIIEEQTNDRFPKESWLRKESAR